MPEKIEDSQELLRQKKELRLQYEALAKMPGHISPRMREVVEALLKATEDYGWLSLEEEVHGNLDEKLAEYRLRHAKPATFFLLPSL